MNELKQAWDTYERKVMPNDAPFTQQIECRRAYYYGAKTVLEMILKLKDQPAGVQQREIDAMMKEHADFLQHGQFLIGERGVGRA